MKELTELKNEFYEVMYKYEKSFSEEGVMANLTAWQTAKADLLSLLRRHPNWNEDEQAIIFDCNQALSIHPDMVDETAFTLLDIASEMLSGEQLEDFRTALHAAVSGYSCTVSEENLEILRQRGGIRCAKDQKASRIIGKLCKKYGVDRHTRYNAVFAQLADALNPLTMQEIGVLSVHPCDFLEMSSKSNTWVSCHRLSDGGYQAGCLSYMNDRVSMVFYAVDADVSGEYRKAIRRYRQMFFYENGTLFQSRLYPADTGNALEVSKLFRHLVQKAISRCLTEPNLWYLKTKRPDLNAHLSTYRGSLHYPDYNYHGIAPYQEVSGYEERTKAKLDEGVEAILKEMREDYTFYSWGTVNSESVAQVICALASCGIDPYSDPRFGDSDRTILTQWMDMFSTPDGFKHVQSESASNLLATYESCYALQWYLGFLENGGAGHPYYLYYHRYDFSTVLSSEADILEFSIEGQKGVFGEENGQNTISVTLPKGMPLQNITPDFTLSVGAILEAPTIPVTLAEGAAQPFTVLAEDGQTRKTYYVTVAFGDVDPAGAKLDTSTIVLQDANQRNLDILDKAVTVKEDGADVLLTVSSGIDVTKLRVIANISYGASASPVLDGSVNLDLSDWTEFTITSADGKNHAAYRIKVQAKTVASITAFSLTINGTVYDGDIDDVSGTISVTGVDDSNLTTTKFAPDITLGAGTTVCSPLSGTEQDFSAPVTYTVAGRDVESRTYTVRVTNTAGSLISASGETPTPSSSARIEKFTVLGVDGEIDHTAGTIEVVLPNGTDVTAVAPVVTVPAGAVVSPVSGEVVNLSTPLTYTVRLGSETRYYVVRVVYQRSTSQQLWDKVSEDNTVTDHQESRSTHRFS